MAFANIGICLVMHFSSHTPQSAVASWYVWAFLSVTNLDYFLVIFLEETFLLRVDFLVYHFSSAFSFL